MSRVRENVLLQRANDPTKSPTSSRRRFEQSSKGNTPKAPPSPRLPNRFSNQDPNAQPRASLKYEVKKLVDQKKTAVPSIQINGRETNSKINLFDKNNNSRINNNDTIASSNNFTDKHNNKNDDNKRKTNENNAVKTNDVSNAKINDVPNVKTNDVTNTSCEICANLRQTLVKQKKQRAVLEETFGAEIKKLTRENVESKKDNRRLVEEVEAKNKHVTMLEKIIDKAEEESKVKIQEKDLEEARQSEEDSDRIQRLEIKLEDAKFEIGRLRTELINAQLESEKIVEENEDLAVDNEDLIKERDEVIQLYDELFRETERLKMEVNIWKGVFENNNQEEEEEEENDTQSSDEEPEFHIEEDPRLLLPPRHDIIMKITNPNKTFDLVHEIGRGKFGKVYKAIEIATSECYVAKYVKVTAKLRQDALATIEVMKKLHNVRLMNIFNVYDLGSQIVIICEYVGGGQLFERIVQKASFTEADCMISMKQVLQGVYHMHSKHICHLQLNPENLVCVNRESMDIKIIDFGLAKQSEPGKEIKIAAGVPEFVAPEILSFDPVSLASDMWSIGVITYVLLSGLSPFLGDDDNDTLLNVSCGEFEFHEQAFKGISEEAKQFISMLLVSKPKRRAPAGKCLNHDWLKLNKKSKRKPIDLTNMREYLKRSKDKKTTTAVRAIRRFSSFGTGHTGSQANNILNPQRSANNPMMQRKISPAPPRSLLGLPTFTGTEIREEDEDEEEEDTFVGNCASSNNNVPTFKITRSADVRENKTSCGSFVEEPVKCEELVEDTDTPDGLRAYLQRMISQGHLPGSSGPFTAEVAEDID